MNLLKIRVKIIKIVNIHQTTNKIIYFQKSLPMYQFEFFARVNNKFLNNRTP